MNDELMSETVPRDVLTSSCSPSHDIGIRGLLGRPANLAAALQQVPLFS